MIYEKYSHFIAIILFILAIILSILSKYPQNTILLFIISLLDFPLLQVYS